MKKKKKMLQSKLILPIVAGLIVLFTIGCVSTAGKSSFEANQYPDYSKTSLYLEGWDGTKLATDIVRPVDENGKVVEKKLPVIFIASRGGRWDQGNTIDRKVKESLISRGYVYIITEMRGCGASYGVNDSFASMDNRKDVEAVIGWITEQSWSTGKVGMMGGSNRGFIQLASATLDPDGLESIMSAVASTDFYYQNYPNGVSALPGRMLSGYMTGEKMPKEKLLERVVPVDDDPNGDMAYEAYEKDQFPNNRNFVPNLMYANMYRDTENVNLNNDKTNITIPPVTYSEDFKNSGIKLYQMGGWFDSGTTGLFAAQANWGGKLVMGPWNHVEAIRGVTQSEKYNNPNMDMVSEYSRWFDYTLNGVENGIDKEPPIRYYTLNAREGEEWRYAESWPVYNARSTTMYFDGAKSGTVESVNDGSLSLVKPESVSTDSYKVDTSISVFDNRDGKGATFNRMNRTWDGDMSVDVDSKALTFTSQPLFFVYQNEITGTPSVDLWVTSTAPDGDFIVYLEEIKADGTSRIITEGEIRASHRTVEANEPWDAIGAVYHPSMTADCEAMLAEGMDKPVNLKFALEPTSWLLGRGSRIRVTVSCADTVTFQHPYDEENLPTVELYKGGDKASSISLPFVEHEENGYNGSVTYGDYTGPASLYMFEENMYLNYGSNWDNWKMDSEDAVYTVVDGKAVFNAGFTFAAEGRPFKDGIVQEYKGGDSMTQPFPSFRHEFVATVPITVHDTNLFVPSTKELRLDVFKPINGEGPFPCIVYNHGYGQSFSVVPAQLLKMLDEGFAIIGIDVRNYPSNQAPDQINDVKGNVRYIRAHADEFGIDPNRIGAYGPSLGGNMTLMLAASGDEDVIEGNIGGNLEYSSRIQAAVAGFAWSDVLYMGKDLEAEYAYDPELVKQKLARSDGPAAPASEIVGFSGPGKGLGVLRAYIEAGLEGTNALYDEKIAAAKMASPVYHISPDDPPIALYHGLGMTRVDIPNNQSYRTFEALSRNDVRGFMFSNTQGEYGDAPEIQGAVVDFFNNYLKTPPKGLKVAVKPGSDKAVVNYVTVKMDKAPVIEDGVVMIPSELIEAINASGESVALDGAAGDYVSADSVAESIGAVVKWFEDSQTLTITK